MRGQSYLGIGRGIEQRLIEKQDKRKDPDGIGGGIVRYYRKRLFNVLRADSSIAA
jgi:hypothetical protein